MGRGRYAHLTYDGIFELRNRRGHGRKDSTEVLKTPLTSGGAEESKRTPFANDATNTSASVSGKRGREPEDAAEKLHGLPGNQE